MCIKVQTLLVEKKTNSRKERSPFFRADAECKFVNCRTYKFYIDHDII